MIAHDVEVRYWSTIRYGRVNFILALRLELLDEVKRLQVCVVCHPVGGG